MPEEVKEDSWSAVVVLWGKGLDPLPSPPPKPTLPHPLVYAYVMQNFINILIFTVIASYYGDNYIL